MIASRDDLVALLGPVDFGGRATIRFALDGFRSVVTRELLTIRMRRQADVFGTGNAPIDAGVSADGTALEVDAAALMAANAEVAARLVARPEGALHFLRRFVIAERALGEAARAFGRDVAGGLPSLADFLAYVDANTAYQELGALKFCLPGDLDARVAATGGTDPAALLAPELPSLWSTLRLRELALARSRLRGPPSRYARALRGFRRGHGYLGAEDVDFAESEREEAIDARVAALGDEAAIDVARAAIVAGRERDRRRRRVAVARFAEARPEPVLVALVLLARVLAAHEDFNRRGKMRLLRDLRNLARVTSLPIEAARLLDFADACAR